MADKKRSSKNKTYGLIFLDVGMLLLSALLAYVFLQYVNVPVLPWPKFNLYTAMYVGLGIVGMMLLSPYRTFYVVNYLSDLARSVGGYFIGMVAMYVSGYFIFPPQIKGFSFLLLVSVVFFVCLLLFERVVYYLIIKRIGYFINYKDYPSALIVGAGEAGRTVLNEIRRSKKHPYRIIGFVDDAPEKISRYIDNVYVYGPIMMLPELCAKHKVDEIIFAIPACDEKRKQQLIEICKSTGCKLRIIPSLFELDNKQTFLSQSKAIDYEELLGRDAVRLTDPKLANFINGRVVFVTGVGSIGSQLCRQIVKFGPKKLVMIDIYENNAYDIQQELIREGYSDMICAEIASVRDYRKMKELFKKYNPDLVFHAAAHKHVPLMETNPEEAVKNNIFGTYNVAKLAAEFQVDKMVLISTDKAVNPTNVMGATKRCCEMVMQHMSQICETTQFVAVRFGNVLGSNGSVIPLFVKQIEAGGPVTVTHPDIIRYFMTIPEAVSLILEAGVMASGGEIFVLDMGEPVKITTLAENLIRLYGYKPYEDIQIKFTGLRPGEKLFEELLMDEEGLKSTANQKIFIGQQILINGDEFEEQLKKLEVLAAKNSKEAVVDLLHEIVPTFQTKQAIRNANK